MRIVTKNHHSSFTSSHVDLLAMAKVWLRARYIKPGNVLNLLLMLALVSLLSACGSQSQPKTVQRGDPTACDTAFHRAQDSYIKARKEVKDAHAAMAWSQTEGLLKKAAKARDRGDFTSCVFYSDRVPDCITCSKEYIKWKHTAE